MPIKNPHPLYATWAHLKSRAKWGGLPFAEEWFSFDAFLHDVGVRPQGHILCVIDTDLGYAPGNVVWARPKDRLPTRKDWRPKFNHPLYNVWRSMINRCTCQSNPAWKDYGGRGITICERWLKDFHAFVAAMTVTMSRVIANGLRGTTKPQIAETPSTSRSMEKRWC